MRLLPHGANKLLLGGDANLLGGAQLGAGGARILRDLFLGGRLRAAGDDLDRRFVLLELHGESLRGLGGRLGREGTLHNLVFQAVVAHRDESATQVQRIQGCRYGAFEGFQFVVHFDTQRLEGALGGWPPVR